MGIYPIGTQLKKEITMDRDRVMAKIDDVAQTLRDDAATDFAIFDINWYLLLLDDIRNEIKNETNG
jgi:hypothetical protein